ncbi:4'-phosphopantetheinyl transferase family protein [Luteibacter sahnii]|uniref:4'-phosphopantetheinyl transferase family protein n=1 Tax=Luteibacter sahnii TaxID=3021977 RepID=UPI002A69D283|nr:4'-phosphopantetheinyl transferase superfamily protein [Luteibacter sp. PPL193]MDY1550000.1 4'-phosphopantetheinyl transferase superfamily protein [Luteibacter sp. PPL193]
MAFDVPHLPSDEIHIWRMPWPATVPGRSAFDQLLSAYASSDAPAPIRGMHGKPMLPAPWNTLGFNGSHSGPLALFAIGRGAEGFELGVDVEHLRPRPRALELARRFFAPVEADWLASVDEDARLRAFLDVWTLKEAVLKAHGGGLSYGLHRVTFQPRDDDWRPLAFEGEIAPASAWQFRRLDVGAGYVAAVAWRGAERRVRVFTTAI